MVFNPDKCSLMLISIDDESGLIYGNKTLRKSTQDKILGVTIDNRLDFAKQLGNIKTANKTFNTLTKVQKYMRTKQKK